MEWENRWAFMESHLRETEKWKDFTESQMRKTVHHSNSFLLHGAFSKVEN